MSRFLLSLVCIVSFGAVASAGPLRDWVNSWRPGVIVPLPQQFRPCPCPPSCPCPPNYCPCPAPRQPIPNPIYFNPPPRLAPQPCPPGGCPLPRPIYRALPVGDVVVLDAPTKN